jgi:hypothetical protein
MLSPPSGDHRACDCRAKEAQPGAQDAEWMSAAIRSSAIAADALVDALRMAFLMTLQGVAELSGGILLAELLDELEAEGFVGVAALAAVATTSSMRSLR